MGQPRVRRCKGECEAGFTSAWVLGFSLFIMILGIAALDIWHVYTEQRTLAARADAAAAAAAQAIDVAAYQDPAGSRLLLNGSDARDFAAKRMKADIKQLNGNAPAACPALAQDVTATPCAEIVVTNPPAGSTSAPTVKVTVKARVAFTIFSPLRGSQVVSASSTASPRAG